MFYEIYILNTDNVIQFGAMLILNDGVRCICDMGPEGPPYYGVLDCPGYN